MSRRFSRIRHGWAWLRSRIAHEGGNAVVEFVGLAVILLIPLVYLVLTLSVMQAASFAADTAARQSARITATESDPEQRAARLGTLAQQVSSDYGVSLPVEAIKVTCNADPCTAPGAVVRVDVSIPVSLPGLGSLGIETGVASIEASHVQRAGEHSEGAP